VESVERFQQSRRVTEDFTSRSLAAIRSDLGKLYYVCSLRDHQTGRYVHEGLNFIYSGPSVQEALSQCHEELFTRPRWKTKRQIGAFALHLRVDRIGLRRTASGSTQLAVWRRMGFPTISLIYFVQTLKHYWQYVPQNTLFRRQPHSDTHNLPDDFSFLRATISFWRA
jgi:hypothetical protein